MVLNRKGSQHFLGLVLSVTFVQFLDFGSTQSSKLSFCDGKDLVVVNEGDCNGGVNFGIRKPDCVCVSGVYRSWAEDCGLFDGFTHNYCAPVKMEDDQGYVLHGVKLVSGVSDVYQNTVAVFGENASDFKSWQAVALGSNGTTWSNTFYALNGVAVVLRNQDDQFICVEPSKMFEKQVCRYFASDNQKLWKEAKEARILVMEKCNFENYTRSELKKHKCYDIVNNNASECQLTCGNKRTLYLSENFQNRERKSLKGQSRFDDSDKSGDAAGDSQSTDASQSEVPIIQPPSNANFLQHKKLNKYIRLRQSGLLPKPDLWQVAPNRTFALLEITKGIVRDFCPSEFVSDMFLEQAMELFVVLHKGQDFRYIEDVAERDFQWIQEILMKCKAARSDSNNRGNFLSKTIGTPCEKNNYIGFYEITPQDVIFRFNLSRGDHHRYGKFHYVIDAIWQIIDMTHVLCYRKFEKSYRMFHVWEQTSEKLFTREIRSLWFDPKVDLTVYEALLSHRTLVDMVNLERCTEGAYKEFTSFPELVRPAETKLIFKKRKRRATLEKERTSIAESVDVFCAKESGDVEYNC